MCDFQTKAVIESIVFLKIKQEKAQREASKEYKETLCVGTAGSLSYELAELDIRMCDLRIALLRALLEN